MRLHILSDLHQEFGEIDVPEVDCDCVVLAGDVSVKRQGFQWIKRRFTDKPVIYICGNHEYYGEKMPGLTEKLREETKATNIHFLEDDSVTLDGITFFGATLWTDMALQGEWGAGADEAGSTMNDYKRIRNSAKGYKKLLPRDTRSKHLASLEAMKNCLIAHDPNYTVVVTHHAPSRRSLPACRQSQLISCAYASNLEDFIAQHQPALWIHGHIHHHSDYLIGRTRVLANPRGYPDDPNSTFTPELVVEIG